jgi:tRNA-modifying protein YgfZ
MGLGMKELYGHMMQALRDLQQTQGAALNQQGIPASFGQDAEALAAVSSGAVLVDRSHCGLIEMSGSDRLRFIHNQTTNSFTQRQSGEGCATVFVTSTARTIDLATVYVTAETLIILTSPGQAQPLIDWMDRYIFPADQVTLTNLTGELAVFSLMGPGSAVLLGQIGADIEDKLADDHHQLVSVDGVELRVAKGSGLSVPGFTLLLPAPAAAQVWQRLTTAGAVPAGETLWQRWRILQGRPTPGAELTDDYNPLEAGLWQAIAFDKGCYIGQETIARLNTYQGVKQQLWGFQLSGMANPGDSIFVGDDKVGKLTSVVETLDGSLGLGYLRTKAGGAGLKVTIGDANAVVVDCPFLTRGYLEAGG